MLKHANYDIENGLKSLKIGFGAIFSALINREIEVYQTDFPVSFNVIDLGLQLCYDEDTCLDYVTFNENIRKTVQESLKKYKGVELYTTIEDTTIIVVLEIDRTVFYRLK